MSAVSPAQLEALARKVKGAHHGKTHGRWERYQKSVNVLRNKGMSYREIFEWLKRHGMACDDSEFSSFQNVASRRFRMQSKGGAQ